MLIISILLYLIFTFIVYCCFIERLSISRFLQFFFLISFTLNVIILEGMSIFHVLTNKWIFFGAQIILCGVISFVLIKIKKVSLLSIIIKLKTIQFPKNIIDCFMIVCIGILLGAFFIVGFTTPPNNADSLDPTHLTRIYYWIQHSTIDSAALASNATATPLNGHLQGLWLFLLGNSENYFFLVQWFSMIIVLVSVYNIARSLEFSSTQALVSSIVCLSFPVALLQTYSSQGDLTTAALIITCISLVISYTKQKKWINIVGAIFALGLALGTKNTAFLVLPVFGLTVLVYLLVKREFKKLLPWLGAGVLILILATGFHFFKNIKETGSIFGIRTIWSETSSNGQFWEKAKYNIPRYLYKFIGFDGLPRSVQDDLNLAKAGIFKSVLAHSNIDIESDLYLQPGADANELFTYLPKPLLSDDESWFGPVEFLLIPLAMTISLFSKQKSRRYYAYFSLTLFISYFIIVLLQRPGWDPYQGRYFISVILPLTPMVSMLIPQNRVIQKIVIWFILIMCAFIAVNTFTSNDSKPIITVKSYEFVQEEIVNKWPEETEFQKYIKKHIPLGFLAENARTDWNIYHFDYLEQVYFYNRSTAADVAWINSLVPEDAPLFLKIRSSVVEYGLFGKNKTRDLFRVANIYEVQSGYFLITKVIKSALPENIQYLGTNETYALYLVTPVK